MVFWEDSKENMAKAVQEALEGLHQFIWEEDKYDIKRWMVMDTIAISSEGNDYYFSGTSYDHEPEEWELEEYCRREVMEYNDFETLFPDAPEFPVRSPEDDDVDWEYKVFDYEKEKEEWEEQIEELEEKKEREIEEKVNEYMQWIIVVDKYDFI